MVYSRRRVRQPRPPAALLERIVLDCLNGADFSLATLRTKVRLGLKGTPYRFPRIPELVKTVREIDADANSKQRLISFLRQKKVRTDSGVAPITLLTKPYACPGKCVYCPTEVRMPKSYISSEPAASRALRLNFDPYRQVVQRVQALERNGHEAKKIELIIKGGTWSAYPWTYRKWFIKRCYDAANHLQALARDSKRKTYRSLPASQKANETSEYRVIGLTIETRPDWVNPQEIIRLRELGVTRVELGIQALDDRILEYTKRGHTIADAVRATILLKAAAFKTDYHFMPGQPGSTPAHDIEMYQRLFSDPAFRPDMVKLYPCVVLPNAELQEWYSAGTFKPLEGEELIEAMIAMQTITPLYCRVPRLIRDFPSTDISGGNKVTNLREEIERRMQVRGIKLWDLRVREAGHRPPLAPDIVPQLFVEAYENAGGTEYFLSIEDPDRTTVLAFLRLRLPDHAFVPDDAKTAKMLGEIRQVFPELKGAAYIRELHTYGQALALRQAHGEAVQHRGFGKRLLAEAERIAKTHGHWRMAVISGIGVREYYRMNGYRLKGSYMVKNLKT